MATLTAEIQLSAGQLFAELAKIQTRGKETAAALQSAFQNSVSENVGASIKKLGSDFKTLSGIAKATEEDLKAAMAGLIVSGEKGSESYKKLEASLKATSAEARKMDAAMADVNKTLEPKTNLLDTLKGSFAQMINPAALATAAVAAVGVAFVAIVDAGSKFQSSLAELSAITGASGSTLDDLGQRARDMAKEFGGSAVDNITAFKTILSKLGPDIAKSPEALESMARSVATLSLATGDDAAASVEALTTAMLQYGIDLSDPIAASANMTEMMNVMAAGAKEGASEVPQVSEALKVAGVAAKGANVSFIETNAALQALSAGGKNGAEAGTALRNVLGKLGEGRFLPKEVQDELKGAGVSIEKLSDTTLPFTTRLRELQKVQGDAALVSKIFGAENSAAATILLQSADAQDALQKKITGTNTATEQAAINMKTFSAQMARGQAAITDLAIGAFQQIAPVLAKITDVVFTVASKIGGVFANIGGLAVQIYKVLEPVLAFIGGVFAAGIITWFNAVIAIWDTAISVLQKVFGAVEFALAPVIEIFRSINSALGESSGAFDALKEVALLLFGILGDAVGGVLSAFVTVVGLIIRGVFALLGAIKDGVVWLYKFVFGVKETSESSWTFKGALESIGQGLIGLKSNLAGIVFAFAAFRDVVLDAFNAIKSGNWGALGDIIAGAGGKVADGFTKGKDAAYQMLTATEGVTGGLAAQEELQRKINALSAGKTQFSDAEFLAKKKAIADEIAQRKAANTITEADAIKLNETLAGLSKGTVSAADKAKSVDLLISQLQTAVGKETKEQIKARVEGIKKSLDAELNAGRLTQETYKALSDKVEAIADKKTSGVKAQGKEEDELAKAKLELLKLTQKAEEEAITDSFERKKKKIEDETALENAKLDERIKAVKGQSAKDLELIQVLNAQKSAIAKKSAAELAAIETERQKDVAKKRIERDKETNDLFIQDTERLIAEIEGKDAESEARRLDLKLQLLDLETQSKLSKFGLTEDEKTRIVLDSAQKRTKLERDLSEQTALSEIAIIEDAAAREYELAQFNLRKKFDAELTAAGASVSARLVAEVQYEEERLRIFNKFNQQKVAAAGLVETTIRGLTKGLGEQFGSALTGDKEKGKKLEGEKDKLKEEEEGVKRALKSREISYRDAQSKLAEIAQKRADLEKQIEENKVSVVKALNIALAKNLSELAKEQAEKAKKSAEKLLNIDELRLKDAERLEKAKARKEKALENKDADAAKKAAKEEEDAQKDLTASTAEREKTKQALYEQTAMAAGASFAAMVVSGENAGKALLSVALTALDGLVPILVAEIFGQSFAQLGPIGGAVASGLAIGALKGLVAVAKSAAGFKDGGLVEGGEQFVRINEQGQEFVTNASATKKNFALLDYINKGGSAENFFVQDMTKFQAPVIVLPEISGNTSAAIDRQTAQLSGRLDGLERAQAKTAQTFTHKTNVQGAVTVDFDSKRAVAQLSKMKYRKMV